MAPTAVGGFWSHIRALPRLARRCLAPALLLLGMSFALPCRAEDVKSEVVTAGSIVIIRFERPVDVNVDRLDGAVPGYISSARRDPDGTAIRLSLSRRVTINTMSAGERIFIDFLS